MRPRLPKTPRRRQSRGTEKRRTAGRPNRQEVNPGRDATPRSGRRAPRIKGPAAPQTCGIAVQPLDGSRMTVPHVKPGGPGKRPKNSEIHLLSRPKTPEGRGK